MCINDIGFRLIGPLDLYSQGFAPIDYVLHDIDIAIPTNNNNYFHYHDLGTFMKAMYGNKETIIV